MQVIEHYEVPSGGVSSIVLDEIPDTFTDLYLVFSLRSFPTNTRGYDDMGMRLNGSTTNYSDRFLRTREGAVSSGAGSGTSLAAFSMNRYEDNTFATGSVYIPNYTSSNPKSISNDGYSTGNTTTSVTGGILAGLWNDSTAINSITLLSLNGNSILQYSSATLYGILAGSDGTTTVS